MPKVKHKYDYDAYLKGDNSASHILKMVNPSSNVLEVGAGQGAVTKHLINSLGCKVSAIEIDDESLVKLRAYCEKVYNLDLNDRSWSKSVNEQTKFDAVLAADVLEHLNDPQAALIEMKGMVRCDGHVIVSLPHIGHNAIHACLLENDFAYTDWGLLDKTHIRFFALKNMQALFDNAELKIVDVKFVLRQPEDTELAFIWRKTDSKFKTLLKRNKFGNVYQCVIKATPSESITESIKLLDCNVGMVDNSLIRKVNRLTKRFFPQTLYQWLRSVYRKINS